MGRAFRASGPASGRSDERIKKITQVRIKRKKRKRDLEELHRNVLEAKRAAVEENEVKDDKSRKKKSKKICDRLLPEPMLGIYENGAKGREICRGAGCLNEMSDARLRGNVLKLLKGDETNPNVKRRNHNRMRSTKVQEEAKIEGKDQPTELPRQRDEDKCRRRLFEPDDKDEPTKNSFEIIDRAMITDHEIRFSPSRPKNVVDTKEQNILGYDQGKRTIQRDVHSQNDNDKSRANKSINKNLTADHFWGWSPATCYERLCARISIDNFENKHYHRHRDPIPKIQKVITDIFLRNAQHWLGNPKEISKESCESSSTAVPEKSIITSNGEDVIYQACTQDSDMDQCSSTNSSATMIGSWHPQNNQNETNIYEKQNMMKRLKNRRKGQRMEEDSSTNDKNETNDLSSTDVVQKTINSVSAFLKQFNSHNSARRKERKSFEMEVDESKRASKNNEELDVCLDTPPRDVQLADTLKCVPRRNTMKHVPTILRRCNEHCDPVELMDHEENPCRFFLPKPARKILKEHIPNDENSIFPSHNPFSPEERDIRMTGHMTISSCETSALREPNYYHYRTPARERSKELTEHRQLDRVNGHKSKFNFMRAKYNSRLSWSEEPEVKLSQEDGYVEGLSDRKIEGTSRDFMEVVSVRSNTRKNRTVCQNQQGVMDFRMDLANQSQADIGEEIAGKRVAFFRDSDRFFNANDQDNVERFEASFQQRKNDQNSGIKARKTVSNFPHSSHHDNPRECMRFSSFQFPHPEIERASYKSSEPKDIAEKKLFLRKPKEPKHPVFHDRNAAESSMGTRNEDLANKPVPRSFIPEEHGGATWRYAEMESWISKQAVQGHTNLQTLENLRRNCQDPCPSGKPINGFVDLDQHRGIIRKPVVLFRPIEEVRQKSTLQLQNQNSRHYDNPDSNVMRAAVRNLREIAFEDKSEKPPPWGLDNRNYERRRRRVSSSPCDQQLTVNPSNQLIYESLHSYTQPAKFLAHETTEGGNPRRIPIFGKSDILNIPVNNNNKRGASEFPIIDEKPEKAGAGYRRFVEIVRPGEKQKNINPQQVEQQPERVILTAGQNYFSSINNNDNDSTFLPNSAMELGRMEQQRSRRIAVMVPLPSAHYHQTSKMHPTNLPPATGIDSNSMMISAERSSALNDRERLCQPGQFRFDLGSSIPLPVNANREQEQSRYQMNVEFVDEPEAANIAERIELPDGRIGLLLAQNCAIGNSSQLFDMNHARTPNGPCRINGPKLHAENRCVYEFNENDGNVYSQPNFQWNVGYGVNEAYHRLTRANGAPDTFTGI